MSRPLRRTARARDDLLDIWTAIAERDLAAADRMFNLIERRVAVLASFPEAGPARRDIAPDARMLVVRPYIVLYRIGPESIDIVRVLHGARAIDETMFTQGTDRSS